MNIVGLQSVIYDAEVVAEATRFQADCGLELVEKGVPVQTLNSPTIPQSISVKLMMIVCHQHDAG